MLNVACSPTLNCLRLLLVIVLSLSCTKSDPPSEPIIPEEPEIPDMEMTKVETLQSNFAANGAVSVDADGNVYVSEYGIFEGTGGNGSRVFKLSPSGEILETMEGLSGPMGTKKDKAGNLFINNDNNTQRGIVVKVAPDGTRTDFATIAGWPSSMAIDADDNLYITNYNAASLHRIAPDGAVSLISSDSRLNGCVGIDFDSNGNLIVGNFYTAQILRVTLDGVVEEIATIPNIVVEGWGLGYLTVVEDIIYTTGIAVSKLYKVDLEGDIEWFAGNGASKSIDGELLDASISNPNGISSDKANKILYISEYGPGGGVRKIEL